MAKIAYGDLTIVERDYLFLLDSTPNYKGVFASTIKFASNEAEAAARQEIAYNDVPYSMDMAAASYQVGAAVRDAVAAYVRPVTGNARYTAEEQKARGAALKAKDQAMAKDPRWNGSVAQMLAKARLAADRYDRA
jgi:hypothetical protein